MQSEIVTPVARAIFELLRKGRWLSARATGVILFQVSRHVVAPQGQVVIEASQRSRSGGPSSLRRRLIASASSGLNGGKG